MLISSIKLITITRPIRMYNNIQNTFLKDRLVACVLLIQLLINLSAMRAIKKIIQASINVIVKCNSGNCNTASSSTKKQALPMIRGNSSRNGCPISYNRLLTSPVGAEDAPGLRAAVSTSRSSCLLLMYEMILDEYQLT